MFEIFSKENINLVVNKKPLIVYRSSDGACGPSGLMLVVFEDNSSYGYSTLYKYKDGELLYEILDSVPEFKMLMHIGDKNSNKRKSYKEQMRLTYLGLGNFAFIDNEVFECFLNLNGKGKFTVFKEKIKNITGEELSDIGKKVRDYFDGSNI